MGLRSGWIEGGRSGGERLRVRRGRGLVACGWKVDRTRVCGGVLCRGGKGENGTSDVWGKVLKVLNWGEGKGLGQNLGRKEENRGLGNAECRCDEVMEKVRDWEESLEGRGMGWETGQWSSTGDRGSGVSLSPVEKKGRS